MLDKDLLALLVCPVSGGSLRYDAKKQLLLCAKSGLAYPVRDGIPVLLEDEAQKLSTKTQPKTQPKAKPKAATPSKTKQKASSGTQTKPKPKPRS